jgi:hypothetical protein
VVVVVVVESPGRRVGDEVVVVLKEAGWLAADGCAGFVAASLCAFTPEFAWLWRVLCVRVRVRACGRPCEITTSKKRHSLQIAPSGWLAQKT